MRRADDMPMDPEIAAELDVIDATLAGDPVAPEHADLAELALLLSDDRARPEPAYAARLDERAAARFAARGADPPSGPERGRHASWWRSPWSLSAAGVLAAAAVALVILTAQSATSTPSPGGAVQELSRPVPTATTSAASSAAVASAAPSVAPAGASGAIVEPVPNGRKITQSAQLSLTTAPAHVDDVAQEVFNAVGLANGIVNSSSVTASSGSDGYAQFQLSIPSAALPQTMATLSKLRYASVASRTDSSQDVNEQYQADVRRLGDARALRTALLRQLGTATTAQQITSLKAQIRDADAAIASNQAALAALSHSISYSQVSLSINAAPAPPAPVASSHGFTIGRALHDAGRILAVAAGVAIVTLAVLLPFALVLGLALWVAERIRRHRREQALDLA